MRAGVSAHDSDSSVDIALLQVLYGLATHTDERRTSRASELDKVVSVLPLYTWETLVLASLVLPEL